jgi:hypothetical protein
MTFVKGQSGNPAGRRPGSRNKVTEVMEGLTGEDAERMASELMRLVRLGNPAAVRAYYDRIWPKRRGAPIPFELPAMRSAADLPAALGAIIQAAAVGEFNVEEFDTFIRAVERMGRILEIEDAAARLAEAQARLTESEARRAETEARIAVLEARMDAVEKGRGVPVHQAPQPDPDLAPATDLRERDLASAADLQAARSPDGAQRHPGTASPDFAAARLNPGYESSPPAPATDLQGGAPLAPATDLQGSDDDWMRNFLGPEADEPWQRHGGAPPDRKRAA